MKHPNKYSFILLLFFICIFQNTYSQQTANQLYITNISNQSKTINVDTNYFIKIKTTDREKIRNKFSIINEGLFISNENDTINLNEIEWIKARKQLLQWQKTTAKIALVSGLYFSFATVPAALIIPAMGGSFIIILAPIATISASVIGVKTLAGRKYKLNKWTFEITEQ
ncbi:MAG: hypothetical protein JXR61_06685 [Prolixibacteraceae bacterium]|nr:hypothetical protein [Prolixibacteraceae bacterium]